MSNCQRLSTSIASLGWSSSTIEANEQMWDAVFKSEDHDCVWVQAKLDEELISSARQKHLTVELKKQEAEKERKVVLAGSTSREGYALDT